MSGDNNWGYRACLLRGADFPSDTATQVDQSSSWAGERDDGIHGRKQINAWSLESLRKKVPADLLLVPLLTFLCAMSTSFLVQNSIKIIIISS